LTWTHFIVLIPLKNPLKRDFYAEMCRVERWSVRALRRNIDSMLYKRTALSKKPDDLIKKELTALRDDDRVGPELVFQDPRYGALLLQAVGRVEQEAGRTTARQ
jgi:predicted nuclease of restriction endonuclease-like (RecB) superfamily